MKRLSVMVLLAALLACREPSTVSLPSPALGLPPLPVPSDGAATPAQIALGRKLFMDRRLSSNGTLSCAVCHVPEQGFAANELGTSIGLEGRSLRRNAPTLLNVAYVGKLFHDGRSPSLESQAWEPLLNPIEMGNVGAPDVLARIGAMADYAGLFEAAFRGAGPDRDNVAAALAAYQRTLVSGNSRFDRWRYGKDRAALTAAEQAGFAVFAGKGRCIACHTVGERHALLSDGRFHNTGLGWLRSQPDAERRYKVQLAPGVFTEVSQRSLASVSEALQEDGGRFEVTRNRADRWAYRTPSLRNVAITGPYMHDGSLATLEDVIAYYERGGIDNPGKDPLVTPLALSDEDKRNLAAFLRSLTGENAAALAAQARAGAAINHAGH
ncbi:cytochrome-c peroxidase [Massilia sp. TSP1-1-2]|uniref:cytochrome-c peroxidase n=1 Tax=Massilia sp. TSP1-1-2 TaxID=2804649 RepID=UPI003CE7D1E9